jgi:hypothetical protein
LQRGSTKPEQEALFCLFAQAKVEEAWKLGAHRVVTVHLESDLTETGMFSPAQVFAQKEACSFEPQLFVLTAQLSLVAAIRARQMKARQTSARDQGQNLLSRKSCKALRKVIGMTKPPTR